MTSRILIALVASVSTSVAAQDLKPFQEEAKGTFDNQLTRIVKEEINVKCGTTFVGVKSDFENYKKDSFNKGSSIGTVCTTLTYAVGEVCKVPAYKKVFATKVKGLACVVGTDATDAKDFKARFFVKDGVFTQKMVPDGGGGIEAVKLLKEFLDQ